VTDRFKVALAVHLFLFDGDKILLLKRSNTGYEDGNYSVPAGHLDGGETVVDAAIREAREECGLEIDPQDVQVSGVMHRNVRDERVDFFVTLHAWHGEIVNAEPQKCAELAWYALNALPTNTIPYVAKAIRNIMSGQWFESYGWSARTAFTER